jgi:hypothetical protein
LAVLGSQLAVASGFVFPFALLLVRTPSLGAAGRRRKPALPPRAPCLRSRRHVWALKKAWLRERSHGTRSVAVAPGTRLSGFRAGPLFGISSLAAPGRVRACFGFRGSDFEFSRPRRSLFRVSRFVLRISRPGRGNRGFGDRFAQGMRAENSPGRGGRIYELNPYIV